MPREKRSKLSSLNAVIFALVYSSVRSSFRAIVKRPSGPIRTSHTIASRKWHILSCVEVKDARKPANQATKSCYLVY